MTRQELADLMQKAWFDDPSNSTASAWRYMADAVIAAGFPVDPEPVTVQLPREDAEWWARACLSSPQSTAIQAACREALGMEP